MRLRPALHVIAAACLVVLLAGCGHVQPHLKLPDLRITEPSGDKPVHPPHGQRAD